MGNDRGGRWLASSPERRGLRQIVLAGSVLKAMALGVSWMGWRHAAAQHRQQRRVYSGRTSERSHHVVVGRVTFEVQGDEKLGLRRSVFEASQAVYAALRTFGGRAAAAPVVLPLAMVASRLSISRRYGTNSRGRLRLHRTSHV